MSHRQTKSGRCAIVEHIECKTLDLEHLCETEAREIGCDQVVVGGETRNEFAEHERRCWEPVKQQHDRGTWVAGCTVEHTDSVRFDLVDRCSRNRNLRKPL